MGIKLPKPESFTDAVRIIEANATITNFPRKGFWRAWWWSQNILSHGATREKAVSGAAMRLIQLTNND